MANYNDNFNRADETPLGAPWIAENTVNLVNNRVECYSTYRVASIGPTDTDVQWAEALFAATSGTSWRELGLCVRMPNDGSESGYMAHFGSNGQTGAIERVTINTFTTNSRNILATYIHGSSLVGKRVGCSIDGNVIKAYVDEVEVLSHTDNSIAASSTKRNVGMWFYAASGCAVFVDDFESGDGAFAAGGATVPDQVTGLTAGPGDTKVFLNWSAPGDGGSPIIDYLVEYQVNPSGGWQTFNHTSSTATDITVTGLSNSTAYDFRVSAINAEGTGTASATVTETPVPYDASTVAPIWWEAAGTQQSQSQQIGSGFTCSTGFGGSLAVNHKMGGTLRYSDMTFALASFGAIRTDFTADTGMWITSFVPDDSLEFTEFAGVTGLLLGSIRIIGANTIPFSGTSALTGEIIRTHHFDGEFSATTTFTSTSLGAIQMQGSFTGTAGLAATTLTIPGAPGATQSMAEWDGTQWVFGDLYAWDGTQWVAVAPHAYDGAAWQAGVGGGAPGENRTINETVVVATDSVAADTPNASRTIAETVTPTDTVAADTPNASRTINETAVAATDTIDAHPTSVSRTINETAVAATDTIDAHPTSVDRTINETAVVATDSIDPNHVPAATSPVADWGNATTVVGTQAGPLTLNKPTGINENDLILVIAANDSNAGTAQFSQSTAPTGFTFIATGGDLTSDAYIAVYAKVATASEPSTYDVNGTDTAIDCDLIGACVRVSHPAGFDSGYLDVVGSVAITDGPTTFPVPEVTSTTTQGLAFALLSQDGADGFPFTVSGTGWSMPFTLDSSGTGDSKAATIVVGTKDITTTGPTGVCTFDDAGLGDGTASFQFVIKPVGG